MPTNRYLNQPVGAISATGRNITQELLEPAYAATLAVTIRAQQTYLIPGQLTGALTINATNDAEVQIGDVLVMVFSADGTARTVTFGDNFAVPALALLADEFGGVVCVWSGAAWAGVSVNQAIVTP